METSRVASSRPSRTVRAAEQPAWQTTPRSSTAASASSAGRPPRRPGSRSEPRRRDSRPGRSGRRRRREADRPLENSEAIAPSLLVAPAHRIGAPTDRRCGKTWLGNLDHESRLRARHSEPVCDLRTLRSLIAVAALCVAAAALLRGGLAAFPKLALAAGVLGSTFVTRTTAAAAGALAAVVLLGLAAGAELSALIAGSRSPLAAAEDAGASALAALALARLAQAHGRFPRTEGAGER